MIDESLPQKPHPSLLPIIFGFLIVIVVASAIGIAYYKTKLKTTPPLPSPSPTASAIALASADPSPSPTATQTPTPTRKPVSAIKPGVSPTPTPIPQPTLDIRFGNPSASVKQTIDEGKGDGRVINREYTSIQLGQFDEVMSSWSPRVTVCFHLVANENIAGKDLKFSFSLDDKIETEDNLGQYDKLEAGRLYDWCHDVTGNIGKHIAKLLLNPDKSVKESKYTNDLARLEWENLADKIAPNFTLTGPNQDSNKTCLSLQYISDNVTKNSELKIEEKFDAGTWATTTSTTYCTTGTTGSQHTYTAKITDARGNVNEQSKTFVLY
ncbi:hypothetical protein COT87_03200 [Candidatus Collierbacteria bacterium CG10_big_fil_rev_8_21_14_0_10_44_9]|uniref:Uncharacterized protein n=1 Tax=Candidatus Collierbacteria bacterium CG10_big_fil_rev_8_21_14_0_10_44_9 TaxID=1974535 RepID=A0A2H0VK93_9BACT|nr:MAG: hypothetical protein COT87_03200 [Candidatus Collierbacteria bacterium CG10_big_fil_rev_8_21_14_0_10_44_9]